MSLFFAQIIIPALDSQDAIRCRHCLWCPLVVITGMSLDVGVPLDPVLDSVTLAYTPGNSASAQPYPQDTIPISFGNKWATRITQASPCHRCHLSRKKCTIITNPDRIFFLKILFVIQPVLHHITNVSEVYHIVLPASDIRHLTCHKKDVFND